MDLFEYARKYLAGGVNSPVRSFSNTGLDPVFVKKAKGKYIYSEQGVRYTDFCLSWGAVILGHAHPLLKKAINKAASNGSSYGLPTKLETQLAEIIISNYPSIERMRFVNSGTEAVMSAIRLARGFTKRNIILKFDGCYHGHSDSLLVKAGSGINYIHSTSSEGVPEDIIKNTISIPYNDIDVFNKTIKEYGSEIACVIIEPVPGNMGVIIPKPDYLETIRKITKEYDILLIFDEVISGYRLALGGAQELFGIKPDLTILGKIIGGGLPVGAFGGSEEIMKCLSPDGAVYQAGTLSGNPLAMSAGIAVISWLKDQKHIYGKMTELINNFVKEAGKYTDLTINHVANMFTIFYASSPVENQLQALKQNKSIFREYYMKYLDYNLLLPPSMFETSFLTVQHGFKDLEKILTVLKS